MHAVVVGECMLWWCECRLWLCLSACSGGVYACCDGGRVQTVVGC